MDWQAWWIALQCVEDADPRDEPEWVYQRAVAQFRADESEREALKEVRV